MMESLKNAAKDLTADMMPVEMWDNLEVRHHLIFALNIIVICWFF